MAYPEQKDIRTGKAANHQAAANKSTKPKSPYAHYTGIDKVIAEMLTENTGINVLDSGGASGRGWQRRQGKDFKKENATQVEMWENDNAVMITFDLFHFLTTYLELDDNCKKLQKKFDKFARSPEQEDEPWLVSMEQFVNKIHDPSVYGFFGTTNTYNYDNVLGGTIQFVSFGYEDEMYMLMQTHNGTDMRGGYSKPRCFKVPDPDYFVMGQSQISASTDDFVWESDDSGNNWYGSVAYNSDDDEIPELEFDVRGEKVYLKGTDNEIEFGVMESY